MGMTTKRGGLRKAVVEALCWEGGWWLKRCVLRLLKWLVFVLLGMFVFDDWKKMCIFAD